jgi:hypothetical protein
LTGDERVAHAEAVPGTGGAIHDRGSGPWP